MIDLYLTSDLKNYYMEDFNSNVLNSSDPSWSIDNGLEEALIKINQNNNIQTLYSKKAQFTGKLESESYIEFAYSNEVELKLFRNTIPYFLLIFNSSYDDNFFYQFHEPRKNANYQENNYHPSNLGCLNNIDYFNINSLRFELTSYDKEAHDKFFIELSTKLYTL